MTATHDELTPARKSNVLRYEALKQMHVVCLELIKLKRDLKSVFATKEVKEAKGAKNETGIS